MESVAEKLNRPNSFVDTTRSVNTNQSITNRSIRAPENKLNNMSQLELILRNGRVAQSATKLDLYSHHIT